jgi:hypothetical protein
MSTELMTASEVIPTNAKQVAVWQSFHEQAKKLKTTAETLIVTDVSQVAEMKLARVTRLTIKDLRVTITHKHKELKQDVLEEGRKIDAEKNTLLAILEPLESRLLEQENFAERQAAKIIAEKRTARTIELSPFFSGPLLIDLGVITDEQYSNLLQDSKTLHNAKLEAKAKAEREAAEAASAERKRIEEQRIENERLRKEAAEREAEKAKLAKQLEDQRKASAAKLKKERDAAEAQAQVERDAAAKVIRDAQEALARVKAEQAAKLAEEQRIAFEKKAAEQRAAFAPDKEKLLVIAAAFRNWRFPEMTSEIGLVKIKDVRNNLDRLAAYVETEANKL